MGRVVGVYPFSKSVDHSMYLQMLAWAAVRADLRVLVVDFAKKGAAGSPEFHGGPRGLDVRPGLGKVLRREVALSEVVTQDPWGGFDVLPTGEGVNTGHGYSRPGPGSNNDTPAEYSVGSPAAVLRDMLEDQGGGYDLVLIGMDAPLDETGQRAAFALDGVLMLAHPFFGVAQSIPPALADLQRLPRQAAAAYGMEEEAPETPIKPDGVVLVGSVKAYPKAQRAAEQIEHSMHGNGIPVLHPGVPEMHSTRRAWRERVEVDPLEVPRITDLLERATMHLYALAKRHRLPISTPTDPRVLAGLPGPAGGRYGTGDVRVSVPGPVLDRLERALGLEGRDWEGGPGELVARVLEAETARAQAWTVSGISRPSERTDQ